MSDNDTSNLSQILKSIHHFVTIFESPWWAKEANTEDVMSAFKLGHFIENTIATFTEKQFFSHFLILLDVWGNQNNLKKYSEQFYSLANNQLLCKLFKTPNIKDSTLDVGVRVYTSLYPKERFQKCLSELILTTSSLKTIVDVVNKDTTLENQLILEKWSEYCQTDSLKQQLIDEVNSYLTLYKVEEFLPRLIGMLALNGAQSEPLKIILSCLENKMSDRSLLSKTFWTILLTKINVNDLKQVCKCHSQFFNSFIDFIKYLTSMMKWDDCSGDWIIDSTIVCFSGESPYFTIVIVLKVLCSDTSLRQSVLDCVNEISKYSNSKLCQQIMTDLIY